MLRRYKIGKVAREISEAAYVAFEDYRRGYKMDEPDITAQIVGAIRDRIRAKKIGNVIWNSHILTSRGKDAEEKRYGADLMGILDMELSDRNVKKGFLAQAKKIDPGKISPQEWDRLTDQCKKMINYTCNSFVLVYSRERGIRMFHADEVLNLKSRNVFDLYDYGIQTFFKHHLKCLIGDHRLNSTDIKTLDTLAEFSVDNVLQITARPSE